MMIISAKVSRKKALTALLVAVGVVALLIFLCSRADTPAQPQETAPAVSDKADTNDARLQFLQQFGWEVEQTPTETQEVRIPETFNEVFTRYNQLQQAQGYDLQPYAGKRVKRYVYRICNHPNGEDYFVTLLLYKDKIIGGDVTGAGQDGIMHGFAQS